MNDSKIEYSICLLHKKDSTKDQIVQHTKYATLSREVYDKACEGLSVINGWMKDDFEIGLYLDWSKPGGEGHVLHAWKVCRSDGSIDYFDVSSFEDFCIKLRGSRSDKTPLIL